MTIMERLREAIDKVDKLQFFFEFLRTKVNKPSRLMVLKMIGKIRLFFWLEKVEAHCVRRNN